MRITLSYFVEPSPGEVGWKDRYRYASHGLRFELNGPERTRQILLHGSIERRVTTMSIPEPKELPITGRSGKPAMLDRFTPIFGLEPQLSWLFPISSPCIRQWVGGVNDSISIATTVGRGTPWSSLSSCRGKRLTSTRLWRCDWEFP